MMATNRRNLRGAIKNVDGASRRLSKQETGE